MRQEGEGRGRTGTQRGKPGVRAAHLESPKDTNEKENAVAKGS